MCNTNRLSAKATNFPSVLPGPARPAPQGRDRRREPAQGLHLPHQHPGVRGHASRPLWSEDEVAEYLSAVKANDLQARCAATRCRRRPGGVRRGAPVRWRSTSASFENLREDGAPVDMVPVEVFSVEPVLPLRAQGRAATRTLPSCSRRSCSAPRAGAVGAGAPDVRPDALVEDTPYANLRQVHWARRSFRRVARS